MGAQMYEAAVPDQPFLETEALMTAAKKSTTKSATGSEDAIELLKADHKKVKKLFAEYEKMKEDADASEKEALAAEICTELTLHTELEEELFYPAAREAIEEEDLLDEAEVEHASAKDLIAQIQEMDSSDPLFDAKVKVLGEYVNHHVEEEEKEMFPKVKKAKQLDLDALGEEIAALKVTKLSQPMEGGADKGASARH
jgi:hemerythrin superfamily protein